VNLGTLGDALNVDGEMSLSLAPGGTVLVREMGASVFLAIKYSLS
jgi:hypothetical protein